MNNKLINYSELDNLKEYEFKWTHSFKVDGVVNIKHNIKDILSFSLSKENISFKVVEIFEGTSLDNKCFYGNILIINTKFDIRFEYGSQDDCSKLNAISKKIYNSTITSIKDYNFSDLTMMLLVTDLFCTSLDNHNVYYCANITIGINEL